jgi:hypothetical protein
MSERPTDTQPSRAAAAHGQTHGLGRDARARYDRDGPHAGASRQSVADRAANFRQGAPFLVERATLYDPEPLEPPPAAVGSEMPPRRLLPAALTLLGVVVVVGLTASVLFVRNADVVRMDQNSGRLEQFSEREPPQSAPGASPGTQPNASTIAYDLTRRPSDTIVGAWRPATEEEKRVGQSGGLPASEKRRPLPRRLTAAAPEVPPEPVTRAVTAAPPAVAAKPPPRYDAEEPKRRVADGDPPGPPDEAERPSPNVVARVGRASEPLEAPEPAVEIPLEKLALPLRRPDPSEMEDGSDPARARRASVRRLKHRLTKAQRRAKMNDPWENPRAGEAAFGDWFVGTQRSRQ